MFHRMGCFTEEMVGKKAKATEVKFLKRKVEAEIYVASEPPSHSFSNIFAYFCWVLILFVCCIILQGP